MPKFLFQFSDFMQHLFIHFNFFRMHWSAETLLDLSSLDSITRHGSRNLIYLVCSSAAAHLIHVEWLQVLHFVKVLCFFCLLFGYVLFISGDYHGNILFVLLKLSVFLVLFVFKLLVKYLLNILIPLSNVLFTTFLFGFFPFFFFLDITEEVYFELTFCIFILLDNCISHSAHSVLNFLLPGCPLIGSLLVFPLLFSDVVFLKLNGVSLICLFFLYTFLFFNFVFLNDKLSCFNFAKTFETLILFFLLESVLKSLDFD